MFYTVNKLSKIAGVSIRTIHYYDQIGLLKPNKIESNGYREYSKKELLKLQKILFFKELEFPLDEIKFFIGSDFDIKMVLKDQKEILKLKKERIERLINTINDIMRKINKEDKLKENELYSSFSDKKVKEYTKEAKKRWGETKIFKESEERTKKMGKDGLERVQIEMDLLMKEISSQMYLKVNDEETQKLIDKHYKSLNNFYEPTIDIYSGLADLYLKDKKFNQYFEKYREGFAEYMHDAIKVYCENNKR